MRRTERTADTADGIVSRYDEAADRVWFAELMPWNWAKSPLAERAA